MRTSKKPFSLLFEEDWSRLERTGQTMTSEMYEEICLSACIPGSEKFKEAAGQREKCGISYIAGRGFPPPYEARGLYKGDSGREHRLPCYYAMRLLSWTGKERRERLSR